MTGYARSRDYLGSPQKTPHISTHPTRGSESVFQWDVWICVGSRDPAYPVICIYDILSATGRAGYLLLYKLICIYIYIYI